MKFEFLWTDKCFLTLITLSLLVIGWSLRKPHIRWAYCSIIRRPIAVSAGIILLFFISIGVLDSIHYSLNTNETATSLLDKILSPINQNCEKTYSAPLALRQFVSEAALGKERAKQIYPLLSYPAKEVKSEEEKNKIIATTIIYSLKCSVLWFAMVLILGLLCRVGYNSSLFSALCTTTLLLFLVLLSYKLSRTFHVFGTGQIGQDIFYFTIKSIRTGLVIGLVTTLFMLPLALGLGLIAGYFGGIVDDVIQYIYTTLSSIPGVLLITATVLSLQTYIANHPLQFPTLAQSADARLFALCMILGVTSWTSLCRLLRAETLKLREIDYVQAAVALGSNWFVILCKHLLPNVMHIVVITLVLDFSYLVMAEALLSYVGAGVSPMTISWGNMINSARLELARDPVIWWPILAAFVFMFLLVLSINLFADAVRDAFDPQHF